MAPAFQTMENLMSIRLDMRSVLDGHTITVTDDGHGKGNPNSPNSGRQRIERMLKRDAEDGKPVWRFVTKPQAFTDGNVRMEPVRGETWSDADDQRLAYLKEIKKAERENRPRPSPLPLAADIARAERVAGADDASKTVGVVSRAGPKAEKPKAEKPDAA